MSDRSALATVFLDGTAWTGGRRAPLAGDASNRRYERVWHAKTGEPAVLMDAPPEHGEDVRPFVDIATHLRAIGLSAPQVIAENADAGFLLLEDLGDALFSTVLRQAPELEMELYQGAIDVLIHLHAQEMPQLEPYFPELLTNHADLVFDTYVTPISGAPDDTLRARFHNSFSDILAQTISGEPVLVQRDYHADNLLWLPDRAGVARVGLLDFQDAMAGHPAFDVMSLLQDVRRDVSASVEAAMLRHYIAQTGWDDHTFRTAYAVLGAQRSLRILGVFGRLSLQHGKPHYLNFVPKTWDNLCTNLNHPALAAVADLLLSVLPAPTVDALNRLKPT